MIKLDDNVALTIVICTFLIAVCIGTCVNSYFESRSNAVLKKCLQLAQGHSQVIECQKEISAK